MMPRVHQMVCVKTAILYEYTCTPAYLVCVTVIHGCLEQALPQLLYYLEPDAKDIQHEIEWNTLAVFTCPNSCAGAHPYVSEYVWVQPVPSQNTI
jgi:hypothetical protein